MKHQERKGRAEETLSGFAERSLMGRGAKRVMVLSVFVLAVIATACASCSKDGEAAEADETQKCRKRFSEDTI